MRSAWVPPAGTKATGGPPPAEETLSTLVRRYRENVERRHRRLDLEVLTPTDHEEEQPPVLLRSVFVPPAIRPDPPPLELPKELARRLLEEGEIDESELPEGFDADRLAREQAAYRKRAVRPVLDVLGDPSQHRVVILGDPGAIS